MRKWSGKFGDEYTDRNSKSVREINNLYYNRIGITRTKLNERLLSDSKVNNVLEVGCNIGTQLLILNRMGYKNLYGIEINSYAINMSKEITKGKGIYIIKGSAFDVPFKEACFDLVFTSGTLIHISPKDINKALDEIYRCSRKYICGVEYFSDNYTEVKYRGHEKLLWKADFAELYLDRFSDLELVKEMRYRYLGDKELIDHAFLLKKP